MSTQKAGIWKIVLLGWICCIPAMGCFYFVPQSNKPVKPIVPQRMPETKPVELFDGYALLQEMETDGRHRDIVLKPYLNQRYRLEFKVCNWMSTGQAVGWCCNWNDQSYYLCVDCPPKTKIGDWVSVVARFEDYIPTKRDNVIFFFVR